MKRIPVATVALALAVGVSACGPAPQPAPAPSAAPTTTADTETSTAAPTPSGALAPAGFADVVERLSPSVATVQRRDGLGSAVVLRDDIVVTNAHVVGDDRRVTIEFADGTSSPGEVLATDTVTDLAVVRTERKNLPVPEYRTDLPRPGEIAIAIGSPLGFSNSVTVGVVSGLHRDIPGAATQSASLVDLIQTDASISPGNSGGALLDVEGRVIGINEAYIPPDMGAVSIGFAIPTATVLDVADQLLTKGEVSHPYLGLSLSPISPSVRRRLGVRSEEGALVLALDRAAPAAAAGVRPGDIIVGFAGQPVSSVEDLLSALRRTSPGSRQQLVFERGGQRHEVTVTVGSRTG
ncbi:S1C family serine protease [Mycolicibacterium phlei]